MKVCVIGSTNTMKMYLTFYIVYACSVVRSVLFDIINRRNNVIILFCQMLPITVT